MSPTDLLIVAATLVILAGGFQPAGTVVGQCPRIGLPFRACAVGRSRTGRAHAARPRLRPQEAQGLRDLAGDDSLIKAMRITAHELRTLASIDLPATVSKDGYVQLLMTLRSISSGR